jgi:hypothetical protein
VLPNQKQQFCKIARFTDALCICLHEIQRF